MKSIRSWFDRRSIPRLTSTKWIPARRVRQDTIIELLTREPKILDESFINALNEKRSVYESLLLKVMFFQMGLTAAIGMSLLSVDASFSLFGISSNALSRLSEFLLFGHGATIAYGILIQSHVHKVEDVLVASIRHSGSDNEELNFVRALRYLGPFDTFHLVWHPYKRHLHYGRFSSAIVKVQNVLRMLSAYGFVLFTMGVPLVSVYQIALHPNYGILSYVVVAYWLIIAFWTLLTMLIGVVGLPLTDFSYVMKLEELQRKDPGAHQRLMEEMARTNKLPALPEEKNT